MKIAEFNDIRSFILKDIEQPLPQRKEVLLKTIVTGICGSEVHAYIGMHPFRKPPSILGHEVVAEVVSIGENTAGFEPGDIVTVEPHYGCNTCQPCKDGKYNLCDNKVILGTPKWSGAYSEYFTAPESCVYKVPKDLSYDISVLVEPLAVGIHATRRAKVSDNENVLVIGGGPIGLLTALSSLERGAERVIVTDTVNLNLLVAKELGATDTVNVLEENLVTYLRKLDILIDHIFVTVGVPGVVQEALQVIKKDGCVTSIALFEQKVEIDFNLLMTKEVKFQGTSMYVKEDFDKAIEIIAGGKYPLGKLITKKYPFDKIDEAIEDNVTNPSETIKTLITY